MDREPKKISEGMQQDFKRIVEMCESAVLVIGQDGVIQWANPKGEDITGYPLYRLQGMPVNVIFEKDGGRLLGLIEGGLQRPEETRIRDRMIIRRSTGEEKEVEVSASMVVSSTGGIQAYAYLLDLSESLQMENRLRKANEFLENVIKSSVDGIIAADMKGNIIIFNEGAERLLGYKAEEVIGKIHITELYPPGVAKETMRKLRSDRHGPKGKLETTQTMIVGKGGERIPVNISAAIIYEQDREIATVGIFTDLRERLRMQKELEQTHLQLVQSEKMASLGKLAAGVAHEINNPLGGILMYANILLGSLPEGDSRREDLKLIIDQTLRCKEIVKQLLEFARQTTQKKHWGDLNRYLRQAISLLENQASFRNIEVIKRFDDRLPKIMADFSQLNQVFINIILNAADAMEGNGTLTIQTRGLPDGETVEVIFSDTGCGIPEENLSKIFDPFFTTKEVGKGTGLGLSMSYGIVKKHGGTIEVSSTLNKGTAFTIKLPIRRASPEKDVGASKEALCPDREISDSGS